MKRKSISCLMMLFLLLLSVPCIMVQAQNGAATHFTIKGQVVDSLTNESVPYVTLRIALASAPDKPVKLLACDVEGYASGFIR